MDGSLSSGERSAPVAPIWKTMGKPKGSRLISLGDTSLSGAEETPAKKGH